VTTSYIVVRGIRDDVDGTWYERSTRSARFVGEYIRTNDERMLEAAAARPGAGPGRAGRVGNVGLAMNMCQRHWDALRGEIDKRGLGHLVASSGQTAAQQMKDQLTKGEATPVNFDPLMAAFLAIGSNAMQTISAAGANPLYLMTGGPEDSVEGHPGRTWPKCSLCYLNLAHEISCSDTSCTLDREHGYDWMLSRAADDAKTQADALGMRGEG